MKLLAQAFPGQHGYSGGFSFSLPPQIERLTNLFTGFTYGRPLIVLVIDLLLFVVVLLTLFFIIFVGFKWMVSQGDKKAVEEARNGLVYALLGFAVAMLAILIVNIIGAFFNMPTLGGS